MCLKSSHSLHRGVRQWFIPGSFYLTWAKCFTHCGQACWALSPLKISVRVVFMCVCPLPCSPAILTTCLGDKKHCFFFHIRKLSLPLCSCTWEHRGLPRLSDFILSIQRDKESDWKFINSWVTYAWAGLIPPLLYWCCCSQGERAASAMQHTLPPLSAYLNLTVYFNSLHSAPINLDNGWRNEKGQSRASKWIYMCLSS